MSNVLGRCIPIGRSIRMPRWFCHTNIEKKEALLVHNIVHVEQQKFSPLYAILVWYPKYLFSKRFRAVCEMEAFWAQLEHLLNCRNTGVRFNIIETRMCEMYFGAISRPLAKAFSSAFICGDKPDDWNKFYEENSY